MTLKKYCNNQYPYSCCVLYSGYSFPFFWGGGGGAAGRLFEIESLKSIFGGWGGGSERLFEAGCLLTFSTIRVGAYSRWALIRGWAPKRINTVITSKLANQRTRKVLFTCVWYILNYNILLQVV